MQKLLGVIKTKKPLPKDISGFRALQAGNYLYVDKVRFVYDLFCSGEGERYFHPLLQLVELET